MRSSAEWYQLHSTLSAVFPDLRPAQQRGLAWWVLGTLLAGSGCQTAVLAAVRPFGPAAAARQYLREWLRAGPEKAAPCQSTLDVTVCFAPLLRWVLGWWHGDRLALAVDATNHGDEVVVLVVSVLYRGTAIPVAWQVLPAGEKAAWMGDSLRLLRLLAPAVPPGLPVVVLADRGLWSPRLWKRIGDLGWHPLLRVQERITFQPRGGRRVPVRTLIPGPGHAWVGRGVAFKHAGVRRAATLVVVWDADQPEPWVLLTDLSPEHVGLGWYGLRVWIELGFRSLKRLGWQ